MNNLLKQKIGQMLMIGFMTNDLEHVKRMVGEYKFGNVVLFTRNIPSKSGLVDFIGGVNEIVLTETGQLPFISADQECGMVHRIYNDITHFPGNMAIGNSKTSDNAYTIGSMMAKELHEFGVNMNLAPCIDVNCNIYNDVIGIRSFGEDPQVVAEFGNKMGLGMSDCGILPVFKHFPGHGDVVSDSFHIAPKLYKKLSDLEQNEFIPFVKVIDSGAEAIMVGHIVLQEVDPHIPASYSKVIIGDILRNKLKFRGLITTDCFELDSICNTAGVETATVKSIQAGTDIIMMSHRTDRQVEAFEAICEGLKTGALTEERLDESNRRICRLKKQYCNNYQRMDFDEAEHAEFAIKVARESIQVIHGKFFENLDNTLFLCSTNTITTIIEDAHEEISIARSLREKFHVDTIEFDPKNLNVNELIEKAQKYKKIVIVFVDAKIYEDQLWLYRKLRCMLGRVATISMRTPYDMLDEFKAECHINAFEYTENSIQAVMAFIEDSIESR